jgi:hypothetical protein
LLEGVDVIAHADGLHGVDGSQHEQCVSQAEYLVMGLTSILVESCPVLEDFVVPRVDDVEFGVVLELIVSTDDLQFVFIIYSLHFAERGW